jgi:hypothetical protein
VQVSAVDASAAETETSQSAVRVDGEHVMGLFENRHFPIGMEQMVWCLLGRVEKAVTKNRCSLLGTNTFPANDDAIFATTMLINTTDNENIDRASIVGCRVTVIFELGKFCL